MVLTKKQIKELEEKSKPLLKWLSENFNPHTKVIIDYGSIEMVQGCTYLRIDDYIK